MSNLRASTKYFSAFFALCIFLGSAALLEAATATWDPNPEPDIAGYILSYGTQPGQHPNAIDVGKVTTTQITLSPGRYYFVVQAYNTSSQTSSPSAEVMLDVVSGTNSAPTLTQPVNQTSAENASVSLALVASDPDGNPLTYSATGLPAGLSVNATSGLISGALTYASAGTYTVTATVSDGALVNSKTFTWTVTNVNRPPVLTQPTNQTSAENASISLALAGSDPDGGTLTYSTTGLPAALGVNATTGVIAGTLTSTSAGTYTVTATVSDGALSNSKTFTWTVTDVVAAAPTIASLSPTSGAVGTTVTISGTNFGTTQGTSQLTVNGTVAAPTSWSATTIQMAVPTGATTGPVVVTVNGVSSGGVTFTVTATGTLPAPWLSQDIGGPALSGQATHLAGTFTVAGAGIDIWGTSDQFRFVYQTLDGDGMIVARVNSLQNTNAWAKAGVMVREDLTGNSPNAIAQVTPGHGMSFQSRATRGGVSSSTAAVVFPGSAPQWVGVIRSGSTFSGYYSPDGTTWTLMGTFTVALPTRVYVGLAVTSHDASVATTATFSNFAVSSTTPSANRAPTLTQPVNQTSAENASISLALVASDPDGNPLTYSATGLPPGLSVNATSGLISGTLTYASSGSYNVTATASDGALSNSKTFAWTVTNVNRAPVLTKPADQTSAENASVSLALVASDPDGNPLTFSATGLPAGLSVNASGLISGTLTYTSAGVHTVTATVSDGALVNSKTFTWTVTDVNRPPVLTQPTNQTSAENASISLALAGSDPDGGTLTYSTTGLPATLSVDATTGVIAGTLTSTSAGTYTVTATVSDSLLSNSKTFTWTVTDVASAAPTIARLSPTSGAVGTTVTISGTNFGTTQGTSKVTVNGTVAAPTSWSATTIQMAVPTGATTGPVAVTVNGVTSNGIGFSVLPSAGAITLRQQASIGGGGPTVALAFPSANTAGNFIAVVIRAFRPNQTFTVSDARGNLYRQALKFNNLDPGDPTFDDTVAVFYAENIGGGTNTVTVTVSDTVSLRFALLEYAGMAAANALDGTISATQKSTTPASGSMTTTTNGDLLLGVVSTQSGRTITPGSGFTLRATVAAAPSTVLMVEDRIQPTAGAAAATAMLSASDIWGAGLVAFKSAAGAALSAPSTLMQQSTLVESASQTSTENISAPRRPSPVDFDGDGQSDITVLRSATGVWSSLTSSTSFTNALQLTGGSATDTSVPGDYDGDGKTDVATFRPSTGTWDIWWSATGYVDRQTTQWGAQGDRPVQADYDGDGKTDIAVFRPSTGSWHILQSSTNNATKVTYEWGASTDRPVVGDYDGDRRADLAVYRAGTGSWEILPSGTSFKQPFSVLLGSSDAIPVPGDYDGDGRTDPAIFRASTGVWSILKSSASFAQPAVNVPWGQSGDIPVTADYDGDGETDLAVFRALENTWYILKSSSGFNTSIIQVWGSSVDKPLPMTP